MSEVTVRDQFTTVCLCYFYLFYFILFALSQRKKKNCERVATTAGGHLLWTLLIPTL